MGWAPLGVTPTEVAQFQREQRYQILPAYAVDGIMLAEMFQGSTDSTVFEGFIEQLLPLCVPAAWRRGDLRIDCLVPQCKPHTVILGVARMEQ